MRQETGAKPRDQMLELDVYNVCIIGNESTESVAQHCGPLAYQIGVRMNSGSRSSSIPIACLSCFCRNIYEERSTLFYCSL